MLAALVVLVAAAGLLVWLLARESGQARARSRDQRAAASPEPGRPSPEPAPSPEAPPPADEPLPARDEGVRVRVLAEGRPLADARVYAVDAQGDGPKLEHADESGTYFLERTGDLTVGAAHARFGPARKQVRAEEKKVTDVTLELPPGETLDVLVVAERGGAPVAAATVYVLRAGAGALDGFNTALDDLFDSVDGADVDFSILANVDFADMMQSGGAPSVAIPKLATDGSGRARVTGLPPGTVDVVVAHPDFVSTRLRRHPVGQEAVARLSAGGSLTVLAPFVEGRAAEGYMCGAVRPGLMFSLPVGSARVDAEGKAFFPHLPPGPLKIVVAKVNHPLALMGVAMGGSAVETVEVPAEGEERVAAGEEAPRKTEEVEVKLLASGTVTIAAHEHGTLDLRDQPRGARIEGLFLAGAEGREGAFVVLFADEKQVGMQETGEGGKFAFEGVAPGRYRVMATGTASIARADCEVKEGDTVVTVRLEMPVGVIAGRVLGPEDKPAAGVRVIVAPRDGPKGRGGNLADLIDQLAGFSEADAEGAFRAEGIAPGRYRVLAAAKNRLDALDVTLREGEEARVELRLDDARVRRLVVKLEGPDGKAVDGTLALLGPDGGAAETLALMSENIMEQKASASHELLLAPGRYRLVASAAGLASALGVPVDVAGDREMTIALGPGVRVELAVEGPDGPLANRELDIRTEEGIRLGGHTAIELFLGPQALRTDGGGLFALPNVAPGRYRVALDGREIGTFEVGTAPVAKRLRVR
jgi:hypothetical protein